MQRYEIDQHKALHSCEVEGEWCLFYGPVKS